MKFTVRRIAIVKRRIKCGRRDVDELKGSDERPAWLVKRESLSRWTMRGRGFERSMKVGRGTTWNSAFGRLWFSRFYHVRGCSNASRQPSRDRSIFTWISGEVLLFSHLFNLNQLIFKGKHLRNSVQPQLYSTWFKISVDQTQSQFSNVVLNFYINLNRTSLRKSRKGDPLH